MRIKDVKILKIKEICDKINDMPAMLASIRLSGALRIVVSYAQYDPGRDEGTLTFYHGYLERAAGADVLPDMEHGPVAEWTTKVAFRGELNGLSDVEPYITEYDLVKPESMPVWCAKAWVKRQRLLIKKREVKGNRAKKLIRRIGEVEVSIQEKEKRAEKFDKRLQRSMERWGVD